MPEAQPLTVRPPLGLPSGSVRALLTLIVVAVVIAELAQGHDLHLLWAETLMIALAHYFTSRRFIRLSPEVIQRLKTEGHLEEESQPLYLPKHTIRTVIVLAFVGLAVWMVRNDKFSAEAMTIFGTVASYVLGVVVKGVVTWWNKKRSKVTPAWWGDLKALVVLLALLATAGALLLGQSDLIPERLQKLTFALVLFYFGSR